MGGHEGAGSRNRGESPPAPFICRSLFKRMKRFWRLWLDFAAPAIRNMSTWKTPKITITNSQNYMKWSYQYWNYVKFHPCQVLPTGLQSSEWFHFFGASFYILSHLLLRHPFIVVDTIGANGWMSVRYSQSMSFYRIQKAITRLDGISCFFCGWISRVFIVVL